MDEYAYLDKLISQLKEAGVGKEGGITISLRLIDKNKRKIMEDWMDKYHPTDEIEIVKKSREIAKMM